MGHVLVGTRRIEHAVQMVARIGHNHVVQDAASLAHQQGELSRRRRKAVHIGNHKPVEVLDTIRSTNATPKRIIVSFCVCVCVCV